MSLAHRSPHRSLRYLGALLFLPLLLLAQTAPPTQGTSAPLFSLPSQDGKTLNLKDLRGQWVVLYFYPKDFTSGCTLEAHNFQRDQTEYAKLHAVVVGVSVDSVESHQQFCSKEGLNFRLLSDKGGRVSKLYDSHMAMVGIAERHTFVIDPGGRIARVFKDVNPTEHSQQVLTVLRQLQTK